MTVDQAVIEQTLRELCKRGDMATATTRVMLWLAVERREGAVEVLRNASSLARKAWRRRGMSLWLDALADRFETGAQL